MTTIRLALLLALASTTLSAQDTTARANPVSKDGPPPANPLARALGNTGNPLARDDWAGTWSGQHVLGTVTIEIKRDGEGYAVVDKTGKPMNGTAKLEADGSLKGEYVVKLLGMTRRHRIELRREEGGVRYRTTGINTLLTKQ